MQHLDGDPGEFKPTLEQLKTGSRGAMRDLAHDWFAPTFDRGDRWHAPCKKNDDNYRGNKDRFHVKMTANQLDELRERQMSLD